MKFFKNLLTALLLTVTMLSPTVEAAQSAEKEQSTNEQLLDKIASNEVGLLQKVREQLSATYMSTLGARNNSTYGVALLFIGSTIHQEFPNVDDRITNDFISNPKNLLNLCEKFCEKLAIIANSGYWIFDINERFDEIKQLFRISSEDDFVPFMREYLSFEFETHENDNVHADIEDRWDTFIATKETNAVPSWIHSAKTPNALLAAYRHLTTRRDEWQKLINTVDSYLNPQLDNKEEQG